eukprot:4835593-Lingulodinium_polyedra.AAC.1
MGTKSTGSNWGEGPIQVMSGLGLNMRAEVDNFDACHVTRCPPLSSEDKSGTEPGAIVVQAVQMGSVWSEASYGLSEMAIRSFKYCVSIPAAVATFSAIIRCSRALTKG